MGINRRAWDYASRVMGEGHAAIALAITSSRADLHEIESPGGYFMGIARKFEKGEANLEGSVWGILKRC
jgi:dienelactone hydrolase